MTDSETDVRAAIGGDPAARDRLLEALWPRAYRLAASILGDRSGAEEAAQDALVAVATRLETLRDPAAFPLWSTRVVVNAARTALRRRARERPLTGAEKTVGFEDASAQRMDVLAALASLPEWLRIPLVLRHVDGLSSSEIGAALGAPAATIRFRLALARRRIAAALRETDAAAHEEFA
ncbi:MAG TPA: sigma-70 family RNA polymerase sigma factor [Candidatus Elarobacter sp.]|nr:sigma-70 family RNA polymerase sigma factor [Candidatus Elarobacter sp.]